MPADSNQIDSLEDLRLYCGEKEIGTSPRVIRAISPTGVSEIDAVLDGGLPVGAITEMIGPESSGRTAVALSFLRHLTHTGKVCAWIDVSDTLSPESAAAAGIDLARLLWVRCGVLKATTTPSDEYKFSLSEKYLIAAPTKNGLRGGGCGAHPRNEVKGLPSAMSGLLRTEAIAPRCAEPLRKVQAPRETFVAPSQPNPPRTGSRINLSKPWSRIEQALRVTDLLLQAGGFSAVVLTRSKFLLVEGPLQNQDNVIHVKAIRLTALSDRALEVQSHDFH